MCTNLSFANRSHECPVISARTMDFPVELTTFVRFIPRRQEFPETPKPEEMHWRNRYAFIGVAHTMPGLFVQAYSDGLNEAGLSAACLWLEGSEYPKPRSGVPILYNANLVSYILGSFRNIAETEEGLNQITVVGISNPIETPVHLVITDASGNHLIVEYVAGEVKTYRSSTGVLTNEPTYDWHLTNLKNYVNLDLVNNPKKVDNGGELFGSGQLGSPGDPTSASRFIRADLFSRSLFKPESIQQSIGLAAQVIGTLAVPCGTEVASGPDPYYNWTQWVVIRDHTNCGFYFYSAFNSALYGIHLRELNPHAADREEIDIIQPNWYTNITGRFR